MAQGEPAEGRTGEAALAALTAQLFRCLDFFSLEATCQVLFWGYHSSKKWASCGNRDTAGVPLSQLRPRGTDKRQSPSEGAPDPLVGLEVQPRPPAVMQ